MFDSKPKMPLCVVSLKTPRLRCGHPVPHTASSAFTPANGVTQWHTSSKPDWESSHMIRYSRRRHTSMPHSSTTTIKTKNGAPKNIPLLGAAEKRAHDSDNRVRAKRRKLRTRLTSSHRAIRNPRPTRSRSKVPAPILACHLCAKSFKQTQYVSSNTALPIP